MEISIADALKYLFAQLVISSAEFKSMDPKEQVVLVQWAKIEMVTK